MTDFAEQLQDALGGNYQLDRELTGGGMSRVFVATDRQLGRKVVVKVLPPELAAGVNRDRFRREIQVAAQLQHPHIVPLLSAGEQGDLLWYIMPYIDGESLRAALERKRHFSAREVMRILHDIVDALAFAHERGVIHRDIKPANILTQGSHALVTDFGVAKALSAALPSTGLTSAGIAIGTPAYMAPEQLAGDAAADHRIDIYAVGLLAYELVTGVSPFTGPSPRETLAAQLTRDPKPLHELSAEIPRSLSALIMRCLAKDPAQRPQRAEDILLELDSMTMPLGMTPQSGGTPASSRQRSWKPYVAVAVLLVVAGIGYAASRSRSTKAPEVVQSAAPTLPVPPVPNAPSAPRGMTDSGARAAASPAASPAPSPASSPASSPARVAKPLISHDDSIRIADAVRKKVEASRMKDSVAKAALAEQTARRMTDSIIAANSAVSSAADLAPRRLVITEPADVRGWPEAGLLGRAVADSLRRMLRARGQQYTLVDPDTVRAALGRTREVNELVRTLNADLLVTIRLIQFPHDSGLIQLQAYDPGAVPVFRQRVASGKPVPKNQVLTNLDVLLLSTVTSLDDMRHAPRRQIPGAPPPPASH